MSVFSVLQTPRPRVWSGPLAELLLFGTILGVQDVAVATDVPGLRFQGDGVNPINKLTPINGIKQSVNKPINTTAAGTVAAITDGIRNGLISSTSAAAVTLTLPTAVQLAAAFKGIKGTTIEFTVDNAGGASAVTVAVAAGVTVATAVITGADTLAVAAAKVGIFRLYFVSSTAVLLSRVQ